jgi:hypothetical protein
VILKVINNLNKLAILFHQAVIYISEAAKGVQFVFKAQNQARLDYVRQSLSLN